MKESDILFENGDYWIKKANHGFEVYRQGITHSTRVAIIGYEGAEGLEKAKNEIEKRLTGY
jgi:hypothetical protein